MIEKFRITLKHYRTIVHQGTVNLPEESGGFLGGKDGLISAIQPIFNQHLYSKVATFSFTSEDIIRAHEFFKKHNLDYYGLYHTHPKGVAYPSQADIDTGHRYHFILSLRDKESPVFAAYYIKDKTPIQIPFEIIPDDGFEKVDLHGLANLKSKTNPYQVKTTQEEAAHLHKLIENIKDEKANDYPKLPPKHMDRSDFSTFA